MSENRSCPHVAELFVDIHGSFTMKLAGLPAGGFEERQQLHKWVRLKCLIERKNVDGEVLTTEEGACPIM